MTTSEPFASSMSSTLKLRMAVPTVSSTIVTLVTLAMVGGSFTGATL